MIFSSYVYEGEVLSKKNMLHPLFETMQPAESNAINLFSTMRINKKNRTKRVKIDKKEN